MFNSSLPYVLLTVKYESDRSFHIKTYVYRVTTPAGNYIIHLEEYTRDTYVIKFFPARFKRNENRFHMISNDNVMQVVLGTALQIFVSCLKNNNRASLGFVATASFLGQFREARENNQRFRLYKQIMQNFFGLKTFAHFVDVSNSTYLMANRSNQIPEFVAEMQYAFSYLYPDMFDLSFTEI
ncbi:hypothetical protein [Puia dinghuensis]|uniref:Uncharacterized protein n=1 Tax=Puia dinghuensis TaxID=1792502 RepID=A0A8J2UKD3_9BACT|nr:hypothetical protein [Puia dinghuensis]GGB26360.1 hypothetical protein GCM10011511_57900 [Puia dinghuensis]